MKLYDMSAEFIAAMAELERLSESGEISAEVMQDTLEGLAGEWEAKALNVAKMIAGIDAEAAALKEIENRKARQRKTLENRANWLRQYLLSECIRTGLTPKDSEIAIKIGKSSAVIVDDETAIPADYKREIPASYLADKAMIKKAIADGFEVPGAHIENRQTLQIK